MIQANTPEFLDLMALREAVIRLEPEHFDRAIQASHQVAVESRRWQVYLNELALCGFLAWWDEQAIDQVVECDRTSLRPIQALGFAETICRLQIGDFTLCLLVTESIAQEVISVSRAVIDLPEFVAHFYVLIEVQEEQEQVILRGCLRYDQLRQQTQKLAIQPNWTYALPCDWFDPDASHLRFYLRFLDPAALPLSVPPPAQLTQRSQVRSALATLLPQVLDAMEPDATKPDITELWQELTWEQGMALFTSPPLLLALASRDSRASALTQVFAQLSQPAINLWNWTQAVWTQTASAWSQPRELVPAAAMRRSPVKIESALQDLMQRQDLEIPPTAHYAYTSLAEEMFQLCAATWSLSESAASGWALLLLLVAPPGKTLPLGTKLQVSTEILLAEVVLESADLYLYVLVEGSPNEAFTATIGAPDLPAISLPAFVYHGSPA
jgi:hypothetical protein